MFTPIRSLTIALAALALSALPASAQLSRLFVPDKELEHPVWLEHSKGSTETVDHTAWDGFLGRYVSTDDAGINRVAYAEVSDNDTAELKSYLTALQRVDPATLDRAEQLAFWINLYNAQTVALILDAYPVESIREVNGGLLGSGPWGDEVLTVKGRTLSLNDVEHGIVRPVFEDARIHYALNCAALSCPNLKATAWQGATLDRELDEAERAYVNDPRGVRLENGKLVLSTIYSWFREDFGANESEIIARLKRSANGRAKAALNGRSEIDDYAYDWSLNMK